jgi:hypothetical protein
VISSVIVLDAGIVLYCIAKYIVQYHLPYSAVLIMTYNYCTAVSYIHLIYSRRSESEVQTS